MREHGSSDLPEITEMHPVWEIKEGKTKSLMEHITSTVTKVVAPVK